MPTHAGILFKSMTTFNGLMVSLSCSLESIACHIRAGGGAGFLWNSPRNTSMQIHSVYNLLPCPTVKGQVSGFCRRRSHQHASHVAGRRQYGKPGVTSETATGWISVNVHVFENEFFVCVCVWINALFSTDNSPNLPATLGWRCFSSVSTH